MDGRNCYWTYLKPFQDLINRLLFQAWDMGMGFKMPDLYKTGYTVSALSLVAALALAAM